jgi:sporadic carbohydrate cluster 2OG-Fe(II) oxygenase
MNENKDIAFFQKNGYLIKKTTDIESLNKLQDFVYKILSENKKNILKDKIKYFEALHKFVTKKELNEFRVKAITSINKSKQFRDYYYDSSKEILDCLVGNEIAMQKKINLSIQIPNDNKSMLPMHSDIYAGESPFEVVIWIPLMNVKKSSHSMFITNPKDNVAINKEITKSKNKTIIKIYNKFKKKFKFLKINYGEILVFSPIIQHGNVVNTTTETRVSLNCRFKSLLAPYDVFSKTHRNIPHFFQPHTIKPLTKIGFNFIETVNRKKFHGSL